MKFTSEFEALRTEIKAAATEISEVSGLPEELISRFLIHGIFLAVAHCREHHGVEMPIDPQALLAEAIGPEMAEKMISKLDGGESTWTAGSREERPTVVIMSDNGGWKDKH